MSKDPFAEIRVWGVCTGAAWDTYLQPGVVGRSRDFHHPELGFGTLSEHIDTDTDINTKRIARYSIELASSESEESIEVETLPSPFDLLVLADEDLSRTIIEQGIKQLADR